jgi:hypothetical protein
MSDIIESLTPYAVWLVILSLIVGGLVWLYRVVDRLITEEFDDDVRNQHGRFE